MSDGSLNLFRLGARGVNVSTSPTHLTDDELTSAQNAEVVSDGGDYAIDQRPGMTRVNATTLGSSVATVHDILAAFLSDYTPYLYAGLYPGSTHNWRRSADGVTWTDVDVPVKPFSSNQVIGSFKNMQKAVTVGRYLYFLDATNNIHQFDGTTDNTLSVIPPAVTGANLTTPLGPALTVESDNFTFATTYTYKLVAKQGSAFNSIASPGLSIVGMTPLGASSYIALTFGQQSAGATSYDVYRTVGGATQGKIGSVPVVAGVPSLGNGSGLTGQTWGDPSGMLGPAVVQHGTTGATTYTYKYVLTNGASHSGASLPSTVPPCCRDRTSSISE
jgi:hypothetical protein